MDNFANQERWSPNGISQYDADLEGDEHDGREPDEDGEPDNDAEPQHDEEPSMGWQNEGPQMSLNTPNQDGESEPSLGWSTSGQFGDNNDREGGRYVTTEQDAAIHAKLKAKRAHPTSSEAMQQWREKRGLTFGPGSNVKPYVRPYVRPV